LTESAKFKKSRMSSEELILESLNFTLKTRKEGVNHLVV
jgi:hypothetical protein